MVTVRTPVEGFTGRVAGVDFRDGVGETTDRSALAYFARQGYQIGEGDGLAALTVSELREHAERAGIDLTGATRKADIIDVIEQAEDATAAGEGDGLVGDDQGV